jgi:hypothetical protein
LELLLLSAFTFLGTMRVLTLLPPFIHFSKCGAYRRAPIFSEQRLHITTKDEAVAPDDEDDEEDGATKVEGDEANDEEDPFSCFAFSGEKSSAQKISQ